MSTKPIYVKMICDYESPCFAQMVELSTKDRYSVNEIGHCIFCKQNLYIILKRLEESSKPKLTIIK